DEACSQGRTSFHRNPPLIGPHSLRRLRASLSHTSSAFHPGGDGTGRGQKCDNLRPMQPLQIAILAAGKGKRMHSALPKVLHTLAGKPLLAHVLTTARSMNPRAICVVEGAGDDVRRRFPDADLVWSRQDPPRGTGDALRCALATLPPDGVTLVLFGADPMARVATLEQVVAHARRGALSLLT